MVIVRIGGTTALTMTLSALAAQAGLAGVSAITTITRQVNTVLLKKKEPLRKIISHIPDTCV